MSGALGRAAGPTVGPRLEARQTQTLQITPRLAQAIKLLQLSSLDLAVHVAGEIERNPLLAEAVETEETAEPEGEDTAALDFGAETLDAETLDAEPDDIFERDGPPAPATGGAVADGPDAYGADLAERAADARTLADHIRPQIALALPHPMQGLIAHHILDRLEPDGYLRDPLDEIAALVAAPLAAVRTVLARLQALEPAGLFARDLAECLSLQLAARDRLDPAMRALLERLDLVGASDGAALLKHLACWNIDREDLRQMLADIRACDPRPGLRFAAAEPEPAAPDVLVSGRPGRWRVELNPAALPRVLVDRDYHAQISARATKAGDRAAAAFLDTCLGEADWLVRALDQRQRTVLAVATEIVRRQEDFFSRGPSALHGLTMAQLAESVDRHESTVSRAVDGKTMATPYGVVPMKLFFGTALGPEGDSSNEAAKARIKALVDAEPVAKPLSDEALRKALAEQGVTLARRTVAKYREAVGIASSSQRRRAGSL